MSASWKLIETIVYVDPKTLQRYEHTFAVRCFAIFDDGLIFCANAPFRVDASGQIHDTEEPLDIKRLLG